MSTGVRLVQAAGLAASVPYSYAAVAPAGSQLVFLAGACPLDGDGRTVALGDIVGQTAACVANMRVALGAAGATLTDVVFVRVLVASTSREDLASAWEIVRQTFDPHMPAGTLQGVSVLGWEDQLVEVEAIAAVARE